MVPALTRSVVVVAAGAFLWLTGCQQPHHTVSETDVQAKVIGCKLCYDRTVTVRKMGFKGPGLARRHTVVKHMCPDCKVDAEIYTEDGQLMIKCAKCAPEGVRCDQCLPPKSGA